MTDSSPADGTSDALSACACMNLRKTARLIAQFYDRRLLPGGLRNTQFTLLAMIGHLAPVSITDLASHMGMDRTTLTRNLRLLERDGYIAVQPGQDARVRMISLTGQGQDIMEETRPYWQQAQSEFLEKFGRDRWIRMREDLADISKIVTRKT